MPAGFAAASARLANLVSGGGLLAASEHAYHEASGLLRVGPAPGISRLVRVEFGELAVRGESAYLALRWEAGGPAGLLFPTLDADIVLTPAGDEATLLQFDGVYRAPLGVFGAGIDSMVLHRVATATIRGFVSRVAALIVDPAPEGAAGTVRPEWSPEPGTS